MIKMQSFFVDLYNQCDQSSIEEEWGQPILGKLGKIVHTPNILQRWGN